MEYFIKILLTFIFTTTILLSTPLHLTPSEKKWLIDNPTLYVGMDSNWKPIEFKKKDKFMGYSVDLITKVSKILNIKIKKVEIKQFSHLNKMIKNKKISMFSAVVQTEQRMKYLQFGDHHLTLNTAICSLKKNKVNNLHDLKAKKIAVVKGYAISEFLKNDYPDINLMEVESPQEALSFILESKVDAYLDVKETLKYFIQEKKYSKLVLTDTPAYKLNIGFSVPKEDKVLLQILQKALLNISEIEKNFLSNKWLQSNTYENKPLMIKFFILFSLLFLFIYIYILKNEKYR